MNKGVFKLMATMALTAGSAFLFAQGNAKEPSTVVVPKKNAVSAKEAAAIKKIQDAKAPDEIIAAVDNLVTNFPDSIFKGAALYEAAEAADRKSDYATAVHYGDLAIEADPMRFDAMLLVAGELGQHTQKYDLDKEEKLTKSEKYVKQALDLIPTAAKPAPSVNDAEWESFKKDKTAEAHKDLGLVATARTKFDVAASEFKIAVDTETSPDTVLMARLGNAYNETGKYNDALTVLNQVLGTANLNPSVKAFADQEKLRAERGLKGQK